MLMDKGLALPFRLILRASSGDKMLWRQATRVEERADVAAEYEAYLQEKERKSKGRSSSGGGNSKTSPQQAAPAFESMAARQEARRQNVRSRIGLDVHSSN
ncbi:hypothetical protein PHYSODRAFT_339658 [Phytophthora sojae]|uniref:Uncharacterized protein n=1 Tax=Phytophthora sojae (strain P6497) TaxID=1094619 RepID=G5A5C5_PHYSP|nr:hypothetical protein PHYSODRAFT_339658 [Phytophthora sojae]EGZ09309.1 hypothetical protein PHYSODRAFT_339658 [Phytophthora sojae]|eukprot:XP_009535942.1 hypothetical protein PHYSODRAFT_339658 [Phytophthora sojae]